MIDTHNNNNNNIKRTDLVIPKLVGQWQLSATAPQFCSIESSDVQQSLPQVHVQSSFKFFQQPGHQSHSSREYGIACHGRQLDSFRCSSSVVDNNVLNGAVGTETLVVGLFDGTSVTVRSLCTPTVQYSTSSRRGTLASGVEYRCLSYPVRFGFVVIVYL